MLPCNTLVGSLMECAPGRSLASFPIDGCPGQQSSVVNPSIFRMSPRSTECAGSLRSLSGHAFGSLESLDFGGYLSIEYRWTSIDHCKVALMTKSLTGQGMPRCPQSRAWSGSELHIGPRQRLKQTTKKPNNSSSLSKDHWDCVACNLSRDVKRK